VTLYPVAVPASLVSWVIEVREGGNKLPRVQGSHAGSEQPRLDCSLVLPLSSQRCTSPCAFILSSLPFTSCCTTSCVAPPLPLPADTERTLCCLLENYQTADGVRVPEVLRPFMMGIDFIPFK
jgi:hypothetical protein